MRYFLSWLMRQLQRQDPVGDLARDVKADKAARKPRWDSTRSDWRVHLLHLGACDAALEAMEVAWDEFEHKASEQVAAKGEPKSCKNCIANQAWWTSALSQNFPNYCIEHEKHITECPPASECDWFLPYQCVVDSDGSQARGE